MSQIHHLRDAALMEEKELQARMSGGCEPTGADVCVTVRQCTCIRTDLSAACGFACTGMQAKAHVYFVCPRMCGGHSRSAYCPSDV